MYDEALAVFAQIDPARVVDPATCLFYEAVCQQQLLKKTEGLETLDKLLHRTEGVAESYARVAALMQDELQSLDDQTLDGVSRKMQDSERRLDLGRGGQRVQKVQEEIVESLTELIKKMEQQANPQPQPGQGDNNSNRSIGAGRRFEHQGCDRSRQRRQEKPEEARRLGQPARKTAS